MSLKRMTSAVQRCFLACGMTFLLLMLSATATAQKIAVITGSSVAYVYSPGSSSANHGNNGSQKTCHKFTLSQASLTNANSCLLYSDAEIKAVSWVGEGTYQNGKFTGVLYKEGCSVRTADQGSGSANITKNNCNMYPGHAKCDDPNWKYTPCALAGGTGFCVFMQGTGKSLAMYYNYVEVIDLPVDMIQENFPCP